MAQTTTTTPTRNATVRRHDSSVLNTSTPER